MLLPPALSPRPIKNQMKTIMNWRREKWYTEKRSKNESEKNKTKRRRRRRQQDYERNLLMSINCEICRFWSIVYMCFWHFFLHLLLISVIWEAVTHSLTYAHITNTFVLVSFYGSSRKCLAVILYFVGRLIVILKTKITNISIHIYGLSNRFTPMTGKINWIILST